MSRQVIPYLVKFFSERSHADQFVAGSLFFNRLSYFKKIEGRDGRPDANEAVALWWQPNDISIQFSAVPELNITSKDLAGPVSMSYNYHDYLHIFCMYAISIPDYVFGQPTFECNEDEAASIKKLLTFDERCFQFGEFAVVVHTGSFIERLKTALKGRYACKARAVEYYDERLFHGSFDRNDIPFRKQKRFEYQREFRFCIDTGTKDVTPFILNIGSIEDISRRVQSKQLNSLFEFKSEPVT